MNAFRSRRKMTEVTLTWKDHRNNLCGMFEKLFEEGVFVDCTLAAEGKYLKVHKAILSAVSPYFEVLLTQESEKNPIVILTDIKFQELKAMIDFIYRGKVKVSEEYLDAFLRAAESLQIKGLGRDNMKNQKQNGTTMTDAQELPNCVSHIPLNQHQVNQVSGNENCATATPSSLEAVDEDMDFEEHSAVSSQMDPLNSCRFNQSSTSANVFDYSISSRLAHGESELNCISTSKSLCLGTVIKCEPTSEEEEVKIEFVEWEEECVEEDVPQYFSPPETTCKSTSFSRLVTARGLQMDPLSSCEPYQCTSSVSKFDKSDQDSLFPVSSKQLQEKGKDFLSVLTLPSSSYINKSREKNTEDLMPRIEFTKNCKEFVTEESAFESEGYSSETAGAEEGDVDVEEAKVVLLSEVDVEKEVEDVGVEAEWAPSLARVECGKVFGDASKQSVHARPHAGERPYACEACGKAFQYPSNLSRHMRTHTGERPFACHLCSKAFSQGHSLKTHLRTHTGERPYSCYACGKTFAESAALKTHLRIHTGERPFACEVCGKAFRQSSALAKHLRSHAPRSPTTPFSSANSPR